VLTDGAIWRLYRHTTVGAAFVDEMKLVPSRLDERAFRWWLGAVLSTERQVSPTARAIEERLGSSAPSFLLVRSALLDCWETAAALPTVALKRELWAKLLRSALGSQFEDTDELFVEHTYLVLLATLAHRARGSRVRSERGSP
jgi:hypothetical protein